MGAHGTERSPGCILDAAPLPPVPQRVPVDDTATVAAALKRDGAVILTDLGPIDDWEKAAASLPARVFRQPGELISKEPVVAGIHHENRRFTELRKQRQRALNRSVSPMERRPIGLNGDPDEPVWGGLGGLTHENQQAPTRQREDNEVDINEGGVGGSMLPHTDGCKSRTYNTAT